MPRLYPGLLLLFFLTGCRGKPLEVLTRGALNFGGQFGIDGDVAVSGDLKTSFQTDNTASPLSRVTVSGGPSSGPAVAVIGVENLLVNRNLSGLGSVGENPVALFREKLHAVAEDPSIAAVVLRIDTPGGGVNASDLMAHELRQFRKKRQLPIVACIMGVGAGGGYYLATFSDQILAQPTSLVGGIGVILNTYNLEDALGQFNVVSIPVKSGEKIDIASPRRPMEREERELLQEIADSMHRRFIDQVQQSRPAIAEPASIFDGRVVTGDRAVELSLIDQIGYLDDAIELAAGMADLQSNPRVVMLRRDNDRAFTPLDRTPNTPLTTSLIPINIPGLDRAALPAFLYLWQPEPRFVTASGG